MMEETLINKVAESGIITIDLEQFYPADPVVVFDLKDYLFMGLILKEKDFREALKNLDTSGYRDKIVAITCSADAIIPIWAYMLVAGLLQPVARTIVYGNEEKAIRETWIKQIAGIRPEDYADKRVVIKGCGERPIPEEAYVTATALLRPVVKSIMYGEPCSTVPVYKKKA
jgi:hypothetical protein